jgi:hypothetical protein
MKCSKCQAECVWMHTANGKSILVDADTCFDPEARYDRTVNKCHWETCAMAETKESTNKATCNDCQGDVVWLPTKGGKKVLVDAESFHDETVFDRSIHKCHWDTCPFRKVVEQTETEIQQAIEEIPY